MKTKKNVFKIEGEYLLGPEPMTFIEASEYCQTTYGTELATINSFARNAIAQSICAVKK